MSKYRLHVPADVFCLVTLLYRLKLNPGAMIAATIKGEVISVWFESYRSPIKRATARLVRGKAMVMDGSPRRVYFDLMVEAANGQERMIGESDYVNALLDLPWRYFGQECISFELDQPTGEIAWANDFHYGHQFPYYRHLAGEEERARREAEAEATKLRKQWEEIDNARAAVDLDHFFADKDGPLSSTVPPTRE